MWQADTSDIEQGAQTGYLKNLHLEKGIGTNTEGGAGKVVIHNDDSLKSHADMKKIEYSIKY